MIKEEVKKRLTGKFKDWLVRSPKRVYFVIDKKDLKEIATILYKDMGLRLSTVTGIDNENNFELIYHFGYDNSGELFNLRVFIEDKINPQIDSLKDIFKASSWVEREINEMLGINFIGHPNLTHLLLEDTWPKGEFPLRKDYPFKQGYPLEEDKESE
ncbi:MAG: NADH-quinone oxidoreductase subunit C [Candidatus Omnitrophica bacterium]|nr:NADH-quinone oxidoreductase subunit C [Candidatus Omnitrophota bacterium]